MAGLAATLGIDDTPTLTALSRALAPRGADATSRRVGPVSLLVRAAIPVVHEPLVAGRPVALVVDGIAEASTLAARYARSGPAGLVDPVALLAGDERDEPYAMILADPDRKLLLLVRNGDGPPLYYARTPRAVLAASEPAALLAAGVEAAPDPAVVDRFLATGACDDTEATFFAGIRRVLPGQVVEVAVAGRGSGFVVRTHDAPARRGRPSVASALRAAVEHGRIGVRLGHGVAGAAILGAALARRDRPRPLNVYSSTFPGLPGAAAEYASAVLGPLSMGTVWHRALPFHTDDFDLDGYLADLGEPTPDLTGYLLWTAARTTAGEVDVVIDPTAGPATGYLARLADRVASRFGVGLRFPLAEVGREQASLRSELVSIVDQSLPATVAHLAATPAAERATEPPTRDILARMPAEIAAAFLHPRYPAAVSWLGAAGPFGRRADAAAMFRRYTVERWMRCVVEPAAAAPPPGTPIGRASAYGSMRAPASIPDREGWSRFPVRTEVLTPGDKVTEKVAWYVAEFAAGLTAEKPYRGALREPWYVLVAAKPVAVAQGLARPVWKVRAGWAARLACWLAARRTGLDTPWAAQVAIEDSGVPRLLAAVACAAIGQVRWYDRLTGPAVRSVRSPREDAVPPAHVAVVPPPSGPDQVAADVVAALRNALPPDAYPAFGGCAVVGVDESGCRLLGWADRSSTGTAACPAPLVAVLCADDPFGEGGAQTPLVVAVRAPRRQAAGRKSKRR